MFWCSEASKKLSILNTIYDEITEQNLAIGKIAIAIVVAILSSELGL
jgi:hypothetical protein